MCMACIWHVQVLSLKRKQLQANAERAQRMAAEQPLQEEQPAETTQAEA